MAALYTCSLSLGLPSQPRIPSLMWVLTAGPPRRPEIPDTFHLSPYRWVSHWSQYNMSPSYWLWGECDQPLGPDRHHIQRSHNLLLISPSYSDQDGKLSTYQNASIHFMTFDRVWTVMGTKCLFCIPEWEKYMMWWWWCFLSSIWGKPQLIHSWPQDEEENEIVSCAWLWVILRAVRSIALGHVVGRCDKTKMS